MTVHTSILARVTPTLFAAALAALYACGGQGEDSSASSSKAAPPKGPPSTEITAALIDRGATVYKANCVPCHDVLGKGDGPSAAALDPKPRDHSNRAYMDTISDEQIAATIVQGGAPKYPNMPSHPHIRGEDLVGIVAHVRTLSRGREEVTKVDLAAK